MASPLTADELRRLCEPILSGHAAVERTLRAERRYVYRLGGVLALSVVAISLATSLQRGAVPLAGIAAWVALFAVASLPLLRPDWIGRLADSSLLGGRAPPDSTSPPTSILYRSVQTVHDARASTERLWTGAFLLGILLAVTAAAVSGLATLLALLTIFRDWSQTYPAASFYLTIGVACLVVIGVGQAVARRLQRIEGLRSEISLRLAWLEQLEAALWARY